MSKKKKQDKKVTKLLKHLGELSEVMANVANEAWLLHWDRIDLVEDDDYAATWREVPYVVAAGLDEAQRIVGYGLRITGTVPA